MDDIDDAIAVTYAPVDRRMQLGLTRSRLRVRADPVIPVPSYGRAHLRDFSIIEAAPPFTALVSSGLDI